MLFNVVYLPPPPPFPTVKLKVNAKGFDVDRIAEKVLDRILLK